jgi:hypothetical protein
MHIIYDLEFDLDSFLNEMEQRASSRQRSSNDYPAGHVEFGSDEETEH